MSGKVVKIRLENENKFTIKNLGFSESKKNKYIEKPKDENTKIWRYLDFTKLVSLLDKKALFFVRADKLSDQFEGAYSFSKDFHSLIKKFTPDEKKIWLSLPKRTSQFVYVNCWSLSEYESSAMWKLYLKSNEGIAIQSTFKKLSECFSKTSAYREGIAIGKIKYIEYGKYLMFPNIFLAFLHKRKSFEYEKELRAIIPMIPDEQIEEPKNKKNKKLKFEYEKELRPLIPDEQIEEPKDKKNKKLKKDLAISGIYIPIDLNILIEKIYVSPAAEKWFKDLVESIVEKYKLEKAVEKSDLAKDPVI